MTTPDDGRRLSERMTEQARRNGQRPEVLPPGDELLDEVAAFLARFVSTPSEHALAAVTLWAAHAHLVPVLDTSPRLALLSPEPGSGKTRCLEVLELLVPEPMSVLNASAAPIFRSIEAHQPTLLFDEVDAIFGRHGKDDPTEDLRALLNAGHRRGATIPRCVGPRHDVALFPVFAAVALAGLGDLPETVMTRSIIIRMRRRAPHEHIEPFRHRLHAPTGTALRRGLADWARSIEGTVRDAWPEMPDGVTDRPADVWEPLLAVADAAGGHWPETARAACVKLCQVAASREASLGVRLLADLREVFGGADALPTETILERLRGIEEAPWADLRGKPLDARGLARRLRQYEANSVKVKVGGVALQGYRREALWDAWARYLPALTPAEGEPPEPREPEPQTGRSEALREVPDEVPPAVPVPEPGSGHDQAVPEPAPRTEPAAPQLTCAVPEVPEVPDFPGYERPDDTTAALTLLRRELGTTTTCGQCGAATEWPLHDGAGVARCRRCHFSTRRSAS